MSILLISILERGVWIMIGRQEELKRIEALYQSSVKEA